MLNVAELCKRMGDDQTEIYKLFGINIPVGYQLDIIDNSAHTCTLVDGGRSVLVVDDVGSSWRYLINGLTVRDKAYKGIFISSCGNFNAVFGVSNDYGMFIILPLLNEDIQ
jgi:hypothetical protein